MDIPVWIESPCFMNMYCTLLVDLFHGSMDMVQPLQHSQYEAWKMDPWES